MANDQDIEPPPVPDGCGLLPYVPRASVASITVKRLVITNGAESSVVLPRRFTPDDDDVTVAEYVGGGMFRATARDHAGRFLAGYPSREFSIDGPEIFITAPPAPGEVTPPAPPAEPAKPPPMSLASLGVPIASALPGMPTVALDVPDLPPELRAWLSVFMASQAFNFQAMSGATRIAIEAAQRAADAERESARGGIELARGFMQTITAPRAKAEGDAVAALAAELSTVRAELTTERAQHAETRRQGYAQAIEAARLRVVLESGGQIPSANSPGFMGFVERIAGIAMGTIGPGALGLVAARFGLSAEQFAALTAASQPAHPPGNGAPSPAKLEPTTTA